MGIGFDNNIWKIGFDLKFGIFFGWIGEYVILLCNLMLKFGGLLVEK